MLTGASGPGAADAACWAGVDAIGADLGTAALPGQLNNAIRMGEAAVAAIRSAAGAALAAAVVRGGGGAWGGMP